MTPTPLQLDNHLSYLINLIPDDNVIYTYSHEIHYTHTAGSLTPSAELIIHVRTHFQPRMDPPYHTYRIDPENVTGSINKLKIIRMLDGEPLQPS